MLRSFSAFLISSPILLAQLNRATITGNITDPGGAAIPNAKVFARNSGTNSAVETTTNAEGQFSFPNLPTGNYVISAEAASFKRAERKQIELKIRKVLRVDLQLQLRSVAETIAVSGELPPLQTDSPEVGTRLSTSPSEPGRRFTLCRSPPNWFREFLTINSDGTVVETNSFICEAHSQDFSALGLPSAVKVSNGMGNWQRIASGRISMSFRKMLFDGQGIYFGDLKATGILTTEGPKLLGKWQVAVFNVNDVLILPLGPATSEGTRIR